MPLLALSPHLDDAIFSAAAELVRTQTGRDEDRPTVLTVFAGDPSRIPPLAAHLHELWQLDEDAMEMRRREDLAACREVNARAVHWEFEDASYREDLPERFEIALNWVFKMVASPQLIGEIAERLRAFESEAGVHDDATVLVPLGIGGHVDHRIVRAAAEEVWPLERLLYYEDYPYSLRHRKRWRALWPPGRWRAAHRRVDQVLLAAKIRAVMHYRSQVRVLAPEAELGEKFERDFGRFERFWRRGRR